MEQTDFQKNIAELPVIVTRGLEGNETTQQNTLQEYIDPYSGSIEFFWWILWTGVLGYLLGRFILNPLISRFKSNSQ